MSGIATKRKRPGPRPIDRDRLLDLNPGVVERFKHHIEMPEDPLFSCWHWLGTKIPAGYGYFQAKLVENPGRRWVPVPAHRISCALQHGEVPPNMEVLHDCHVRDCVSPMHVRYGRREENQLCGNHYRHAMGRTSPEGNIFINPRQLWSGWNLPEVMAMYEEYVSQSRPDAEMICAGVFGQADPSRDGN